MDYYLSEISTGTAAKNGFLGIFAVIGGAIANALGGWDATLQVLVALMAGDYISGLLLAAIWQRSAKSDSGALDSRAGFRGLIKKCMVLLMVYVAVMLDEAVGTHYVRTAVTLFFIGNEGLSLLENLGEMGVPYPAFLRRMLQVLHDRGDTADGAQGAGTASIEAQSDEAAKTAQSRGDDGSESHDG